MNDAGFSKDRMSGLGGSDMAKLIIEGYKYGGPLDVYNEKVELPKFKGNAATTRGHYLERGVADWYADTTVCKLHHVHPDIDKDLKLERVGSEFTVVHPVYNYLRGTPDFLTDNPQLGLEVKTARENQWSFIDRYGKPMWGKSGTSVIPLPYFVQCQWYMGLTSRSLWDVAAFFIGYKDEFRIYHLEFDKGLYDEMVRVGKEFWETYVLPQVPPPKALVMSEAFPVPEDK